MAKETDMKKIGGRVLACLLPLALLIWRVWTIRRHWVNYSAFWGGEVSWLETPFPYGWIVLFWYWALRLAGRWLPLLTPLAAAAAPWVPAPWRGRVYLGCALTCVPAFLGEGFLYLVNTIALDSHGHCGEIPQADLALLAFCVLCFRFLRRRGHT